MTGDQNAKIRERAYLLWEQDGRPAGRDVEFWLRAETEARATTPAGRRVTARKAPTITALSEGTTAKPRAPKGSKSKSDAKTGANGRPVTIKS